MTQSVIDLELALDVNPDLERMISNDSDFKGPIEWKVKLKIKIV